MDTRQLVAGTTLYLPVQVDGALFSTGDAHGCQGDGEVCVTGLEAPMYASLRFTVQKGRELPSPQYRTAPGSLTSKVDHGGVVRHDRRRARPVRRRPERGAGDDRPHHRHLRDVARGRLPACSLCVDLKISEIVDAASRSSARCCRRRCSPKRERAHRRDGRGTAPPEDYDRGDAFVLSLARRRRRVASSAPRRRPPDTWRTSSASSAGDHDC